MSDSDASEVFEEPEADQTGANRFDADVAKAQARKEMWRTLQKAFDNAGKIGGLIGLLLGGYATCAKADASDTEERLEQTNKEVKEAKEGVEEAKEATGLVLDYTTAVASSASAAVAAVASAPPAPAIAAKPPPAGSSGCWVVKPSGLVKCSPAPAQSTPKITAPAMPSPPKLR